jgi:hypothetical protein
MRLVVAGLVTLGLLHAGAGPAAAQTDNCVAYVGQFTTGTTGSADTLNSLCLSGNTLPLGNGMRLPFGFLPPNAVAQGSALVSCAMGRTEVAAHGYRQLWLAQILPDALVSNPQPSWGAACLAP